MSNLQSHDPWEIISTLVESRDSEKLEIYLDSLSQSEKALAISRLDEDTNAKVIDCISTEAAADLMEDIFDDQAADIIEDLPAIQAAAIVDEMASDEQADLLTHLEHHKAEEILQQMDPEEAEDARLLVQFPEDTAGGMMVTEFLSFPHSMQTKELVDDLRQNRDKYSDYEVQYVYIVSGTGKLQSLLPLRQVLLSSWNAKLSELAIKDPIHVTVDASLDELKKLFGQHNFIGIPVTDSKGHLLGIVLRREAEH